MQVVTPSFGDHYRNRLTHSLEVSHIARDIARELSLNEDLTETIALAHDLGHPPFGHAGEEALKKCMKKFGENFDHNKQSLRIVTHFEQKYPDHPGLNLSIEVLEGLQKHEATITRKTGEIIHWPSLECQLVDLADEIAYISADLDDGLRGKFFTPKDLKSLQISNYIKSPLDASALGGDLEGGNIKNIIKTLITQLVKNSKKNLTQISSVQEVQNSPQRFIAFTEDFYQVFLELKRFLFQNYYLKPEIKKMSDQGQKIITEIFELLEKNPQKIPTNFLPNPNKNRRICDYISGMTDDFCLNFHQKNCK